MTEPETLTQRLVDAALRALSGARPAGGGYLVSAAALRDLRDAANSLAQGVAVELPETPLDASLLAAGGTITESAR